MKGGRVMIPYDSHITGMIIRQLRMKQGISQEVLSGLAGVARTHLTMIENGEKNANVDTLWRIADALGMKFSELICMVENQVRL